MDHQALLVELSKVTALMAMLVAPMIAGLTVGWLLSLIATAMRSAFRQLGYLAVGKPRSKWEQFP